MSTRLTSWFSIRSMEITMDYRKNSVSQKIKIKVGEMIFATFHEKSHFRLKIDDLI